jgi:hypothetical protein
MVFIFDCLFANRARALVGGSRSLFCIYGIGLGIAVFIQSTAGAPLRGCINIPLFFTSLCNYTFFSA